MAQEDFLSPEMPDIIRQWRHYLASLGLKPGDRILDVGCNKGDTERLLGREYREVECVVGLDRDSRRLTEAMARCAGEGREGQIAFVQADGRELPFVEGCFDKVICAETLEWIPEPVCALRELHRVLKLGGTALVVHTDFDTQVYQTKDRERSRRICLAFADGGPNGQIGRALYGLCRQAGFQVVQPSIYTLVNTALRPNLYGYRMAQMIVEWVQGHGVSDAELAAWWNDLMELDRQGTYFYSVNRYICCCVR